jgi:CRISPR/Cas system endoribonuclease Cas6 (RAMP superfamily)
MVKQIPKEPSDKLKKNLKKRYDTIHDSVIEDEVKEVVKQGKRWTKVGTYNKYEDAAKRRDTITEKSPEFDTKIKRCGPKQTKFKVLKRKNKELAKKAKE